ncbi:MAG: hypothetical protein ACREBJ_05200 [Nitrosotalea sp.]
MVLICPECDCILLEFDIGTGIHHCPNPQCKFGFFDKNTGKKYRRDK